MKKQTLHKWVAKTHKWVGLLLGLQLLAWTAGGVVMTWMPINEVRGSHNAAEQAPAALPGDATLLPPHALARASGATVMAISYQSLLGRPVALLSLEGERTEIRDATTGDLMSPISETLARDIADADFAPEAEIISATKLTEPVLDYRGPFPAWQITFADAENTNIYVSASNGRVTARRTDRWRLFDFFWMLHIMDYEERDDINNPLLIATAGFALLFALSGFCLLFFRFYRRDFNFILGRRKRNA